MHKENHNRKSGDMESLIYRGGSIMFLTLTLLKLLIVEISTLISLVVHLKGIH